MLELLQKAFVTTLGIAAISQKKAEELVNEIKEKYKLSEEEGRSLLDRIQSMARESSDRVAEIAQEEVKKAVDKLGFVPREEFERLEKRVLALENRFENRECIKVPNCFSDL